MQIYKNVNLHISRKPQRKSRVLSSSVHTSLPLHKLHRMRITTVSAGGSACHLTTPRRATRHPSPPSLRYRLAATTGVLCVCVLPTLRCRVHANVYVRMCVSHLYLCLCEYCPKVPPSLTSQQEQDCPCTAVTLQPLSRHACPCHGIATPRLTCPQPKSALT